MSNYDQFDDSVQAVMGSTWIMHDGTTALSQQEIY